MTLTAELRPIDDRSFEDFVAEARARIPRWAREWVWSDLNDNDPGIALVQLFAWLAEQQIFRMARVPELAEVKFLEMIGVTLGAAEPARAEITFPVKPGFALPAVVIPLRTQVAARTTDGSGQVVFETERAITAIEPALDRVQTGIGTALRDVSAANAALDEAFEPFGPGASAGGVLALGFASAGAFPEVEVDLACWVAGADDPGTGVACGGPAARSLTKVAWESWDGAAWRPLTLLADETLAFTRSGHVRLRGPKPGAVVQSPLGAVPEARYWLRARLIQPDYILPPRLLAIRTNTAPAIQAETVEGEILGGTDATLDQVLRLGRTPVLGGSVELTIDEGDGALLWTEVADFFGSGSEDRHFVLDRRTGELRFGRDDAGRIPVGNPRLPGANAVARRYRHGGGVRGNLGAGTITTLRTPIQGLDTRAVGNLFAADGGREGETLPDAITRARREISAHDRMVTPADCEALAKQAGPVARAIALSLHHPEFEGVDVPGVTSVIIVPDLPDDPAPMPTPALMRAVCGYLDARRLLTAELYVLAPTYVEITVDAELFLEADADPAAVVSTAIETLETYFHPLRGGSDGRGWPSGGDVYYSRVASLLLGPGVRRLGEVRLTLGRETFPPCADAPLAAGRLLRSGEHRIVTFVEEAADA